MLYALAGMSSTASAEDAEVRSTTGSAQRSQEPSLTGAMADPQSHSRVLLIDSIVAKRDTGECPSGT